MWPVSIETVDRPITAFAFVTKDEMLIVHLVRPTSEKLPVSVPASKKRFTYLSKAELKSLRVLNRLSLFFLMAKPQQKRPSLSHLG